MFRTQASERKPRVSAASSSAYAHPGDIRSGKSLAYPHRLNFYNLPPLMDVTLDEFEGWGIDRLKVLAEIEASQARNRSPEELKLLVNAQQNRYVPLSSNTAHKEDLDAQRKKDHVGHFVLRFAFCRSEELRARFVKAETMLFRLRFESDDGKEKQEFLDSLSFDWMPVSAEEKALYADELMAASGFSSTSTSKQALAVQTFKSEAFFKVPWTKVTDLVQRRRVFIKAGQAYVPTREQSSMVLAEFSTRLQKALEMTAKALPRLDEDDRLLPILSHLSLGFLAGGSGEYSGMQLENGEVITAEMIDELVRKHAPICMRNLHDTLREKKHLKHQARQQYILFLKGIGLSVTEALVFWRRSFSIMTDDKFNKEHKYNIRHGYGLEGSRKDYQPKSCQRILTTDQPGPQDAHGCPFRHFSADNLSSALTTTYGISSKEDLKEILGAVKANHYHVACTRVYEITHAAKGVKKGDGLGAGASVDHPNVYFEKSWTLEKEAEGAGVATRVGAVEDVDMVGA
uniref:DNA primase large subunit n=1 Tax=Bartheletia paradoxa TaxID=669517 RepID=A0A2D0XHR1_9BASI|nr:hypothetical protein SPAR05346 [Bartheletia paradoxa]